MRISQQLGEILVGAEAKALATCGADGVNVVPVSMIKVQADTIWLFDFFMNKTATNLEANTKVALAAWSGMKGVQLKGEMVRITEGEQFDEAVAFVATQNPSRVVRGLLVFVPEQVFDVSPGGALAVEELLG